MPDRQLLAEAARLRAEIESLRASLADLRGRQQDAAREWEMLIASIRHSV